MALVRSADGRFFEIDEETLKKHQVKPEEMPPQGRDPGPPPNLPPPSGPPGLIQIIINVPPGSVAGAPDVEGRMAGDWSNRWYNLWTDSSGWINWDGKKK